MWTAVAMFEPQNATRGCPSYTLLLAGYAGAGLRASYTGLSRRVLCPSYTRHFSKGIGRVGGLSNHVCDAYVSVQVVSGAEGPITQRCS